MAGTDRTRRSSERGFTLLEALIALAVTAILIAFGIAVTVLTQRVTTSEQVRTELNQNLRTALDLMGADIRIAGERLAGVDNDALLAIEVRDENGDGDGDALILRRNLLETTLSMCDTAGISAGDTRIQVAVAPPPGSECAIIDSDGDGVLDKMETWRDFRIANGGTVSAFIYTTDGARSEFFVHDGEDPGALEITSAAGLTNSYPFADRPTIVALTENRYFVQDGVLFLERDRDPTTRVRLVPDVEELQVLVTFNDCPAAPNPLPIYDATVNCDWNQIQSVDLVIDGRIDVNGDPYERSLGASYFPRNALSN